MARRRAYITRIDPETGMCEAIAEPDGQRLTGRLMLGDAGMVQFTENQPEEPQAIAAQHTDEAARAAAERMRQLEEAGQRGRETSGAAAGELRQHAPAETEARQDGEPEEPEEREKGGGKSKRAGAPA